MSRLALRNADNAPEESKPRIEAAQRSNGFVPNLIGILANAPVALETYQTVSEINSRASLSLAERETVQITAAATHGCAFCVAGHSKIAEKKAKLAPDVVTALRTKSAVPDAKLDAVARFTKAVIANRGAVDDQELAAFRAAGFDDQAAIEVVLGVSLATLCNFTNNLGKTELNPELSAYEWKVAV